jgi:hypothetical protein
LPVDSFSNTLGWLWQAGGNLLTENLVMQWLVIPAILLAAGAWWFARRQPGPALMFALTVSLTLAASALQLYPFGGYGGRTVHFLLPFVLILIARPVVWIGELKAHARLRVLAVTVVMAVLFWRPLAQLPAYITAPPGFAEEIRPVLEFVTANARPGDTVYFYWKTHFQMAYYHHWYDFQRFRVLRGEMLRDLEKDGPAFRRQLETLPAVDRVWLVFSNWGRADHPERDMIMKYLSGFGRMVLQRSEVGASACLFVFDEPVLEAADQPGGRHE